MGSKGTDAAFGVATCEGWYSELLAIEIYVDDCQMTAMTKKAVSTFLEIWDAMREGRGGPTTRNPPRPVGDDHPGAHHQAGAIPDGIPEQMNELPHGLPPPMQGGMPGQNECL